MMVLIRPTRRRHLTGILVLCIGLGTATACPAKDLFVNNNLGDDSRNGLTPIIQGSQGPVRTIRRALQMAVKGDRVVIANTGIPYRESITLQAGRHSGTQDQPFVLQGNGATLDGTRVIPEESWSHYRDDIFRFKPLRTAYQVLYLDGEPADRREADGSADDIPELEPLEWCLFDRRIYFRVEPGRRPWQYDLSHSHEPVGITLYEVRGVEVRGLVVQGYQRDGVNAHDGVRGVLQDVTCRGNGRAGFSIGGASRVRLVECRASENGLAQLRTEGHSWTTVSACVWDPATAPAVVQDGGRLRQEEAPAEDDAAAGPSGE